MKTLSLSSVCLLQMHPSTCERGIFGKTLSKTDPPSKKHARLTRQWRIQGGGGGGGGQTRPMPPLTNKDTPPVHCNDMSSAPHRS